MAPSAGARLGPYEIGARIGVGGMGEVYRARDTTLNRDVAIKTLPEGFALDVDRLGRFQREAHALAALNHRNIAAIYAMQQSGDTPFLVLELVEGDTLADRLAVRGALPLEEATTIAIQICEALEAAHERGIVHRDLKPANVKLTADGTVKVLDFGLAKALAPAAAVVGSGEDSANSPTLALAATRAGFILGTAGYMAPEQATGRSFDRRVDIFAFGCVMFEMLTGRRVFDGQDVPEIVGAALTRDPDWSCLPTRHSQSRG